VLREDGATVTEPEPVDLHHPYDGDKEVFYSRPGAINHTLLPEVTIRPGEVHVIWQHARSACSVCLS
jgi:hypothetical protein